MIKSILVAIIFLSFFNNAAHSQAQFRERTKPDYVWAELGFCKGAAYFFDKKSNDLVKDNSYSTPLFKPLGVIGALGLGKNSFQFRVRTQVFLPDINGLGMGDVSLLFGGIKRFNKLAFDANIGVGFQGAYIHTIGNDSRDVQKVGAIMEANLIYSIWKYFAVNPFVAATINPKVWSTSIGIKLVTGKLRYGKK